MKSDGKLPDEKRYNEALAFIEDGQWYAAELALVDATSSHVGTGGSMSDGKAEEKQNAATDGASIRERPAEQQSSLKADAPPPPPPRPVVGPVHAEHDGFVIVDAPPDPSLAPPPRPQALLSHR